jgi:hypothetical protein
MPNGRLAQRAPKIVTRTKLGKTVASTARITRIPIQLVPIASTIVCAWKARMLEVVKNHIEELRSPSGASVVPSTRFAVEDLRDRTLLRDTIELLSQPRAEQTLKWQNAFQ